MANLTRTIGAVLTVLGVLAYVLSGAESVTALAPAILGVPIGVLGVVAQRESRRKHAIHGALALALLGLLGTLMNVAQLPALLTGGDVERPAAVLVSTATAVLCAVYVVAGVRSFRAARAEPVRR